MGRISTIETYLTETGKIRDYASLVANNCEVISVKIPVNGLQTIYLPQNSLLDNSKIRAIQIVADDEQFYGNLPDGTTSENLTVFSLPEFGFTLAIDNEEIAVTPFTSMHLPTQSGKFYFIDSSIGKHRIGDSFISQLGNSSFAGLIITLRFWYD
tara:strand:- start:1277 stop:1741 length:465 start_codon:yes stop_codon:yes gene_type:complete